jgi:hypothetical protein
VFRQDVKLLELVQSLPELAFAQTVAGSPSHRLMERLADLSRQFCRVIEDRSRITAALQINELRYVKLGLLRTGSGCQI